jgi:predicted AlkP superfamily phosphohydrolase/phosphomutase
MNRRKVVVFGIDGGTLDIMNPLIREGKLPNIASIIRNCIRSELISVVPPITAPAWASFMTGVNPGKHGIFDFISDIHGNGREGDVLNSTHIRSKTIWQILSDHQKKLIVVGVPFAYPPIRINGAMVSISMSNLMDTYPQELKQEIIDKIGYEHEKCKPVDTFGELPKVEILDEIIRRNMYLTDKVKKISCYLMENREWDFFMAHFMATDTIQHYFWHFIDTKHPSYDAGLAPRYKNVINKTYEHIDSVIGEISERVGDDCTFIIVSDHGFAPVYEFFYVNKWLEEKGLLKLRNSSNHVWKPAYPSLYKIFSKAGLENISDKLPPILRKIRIPALKRVVKHISELIDWDKTRAYASPFGININLKGREPYGIVGAGEEFIDTKEFIKEALYKLRRKETAERLISKVYFSEEIYRGPYVRNAADVFFFFNKPFFLQSSEVNRNSIFEKLSKRNFATANHRYSAEGIFIISGPDVNLNGYLNRPGIVDIAPTILYLMGMDIPYKMDGRVLEEIIKPEYLHANPPKYVEEEMVSPIEEVSVATSEDEQIKEHLRNLGYLG